MRRLQIYIPEETYQEIRREAFRKNVSIAEVIRQRIAKELKKQKKKSV